MDYTANYNLKKPSGDDLFNIQDFNDNADAIDGAIDGVVQQINEAIGDIETLLAAL